MIVFIFFFKQKTAYEMRISDWSSDVCSSDLVFLIGALVYAKGLFGGFLFDDYPNIVNNAALQAVAQHQGSWLTVAESSKSGPLHRPISSLSFAADLYFFGFEPLAFKVHNLAIQIGRAHV